MNKQNNHKEVASEADVLLKNYRTRIAKEGWIKSLLCGLIVGFCLDILCAVVFLFFGIKFFWIGILAFVIGAGATTPLFYYKKFKKSTRQVASRVDTLGLEERILTMTQFENDDSYMARRQREDAISALKSVNESLLKLAVSIPLIVVCAITCVIGAGATTASALSEKSILGSIEENRNNRENAPTYFDVEYGVQNDEGGRVEGTLNQRVAGGTTTEPVEAIADDDYVFIGWSDGYTEALRSDRDVSENFKVFAIFTPVEENEEGDPDETDGSEEDDSNKKPSNGNSSDDSSQPSQPGEDGDGNGKGDGAGGASNPTNQVIDGNTFYGDQYGESMSDAQDAMDSGTDMSGEQTDVIGDYFHGIAK